MRQIGEAHKRQFSSIQNHKTLQSSVTPSKRKHLEVTDDWVGELDRNESQQVDDFIQQLVAVHDAYFEEERHFNFASFILALALCERQVWHTDYPPEDHVLQVRPLSIWVSLEPGGGSIAIMDPATGIKYSLHAEVGDVVFLGARCVHAGEAAAREMFKFHLYADVLRYVVMCSCWMEASWVGVKATVRDRERCMQDTPPLPTPFPSPLPPQVLCHGGRRVGVYQGSRLQPGDSSS